MKGKDGDPCQRNEGSAGVIFSPDLARERNEWEGGKVGQNLSSIKEGTSGIISIAPLIKC